MLFHGNLGNKCSVGTNNLIKKGAYLTTSSLDILKDFPEFLLRDVKKTKSKTNTIKIKKEYKEIYSYLTDDYLNIDQISNLSKKNIREIINILTLMEIDGFVTFEIGKGYKKLFKNL